MRIGVYRVGRMAWLLIQAVIRYPSIHVRILRVTQQRCRRDVRRELRRTFSRLFRRLISPGIVLGYEALDLRGLRQYLSSAPVSVHNQTLHYGWK
jgi:hypothetical protein